MRGQGLLVVLLLSVGSLYLSAAECEGYEEAYDLAKYKVSESTISSNREGYDLANALIDSATEYFAYCKEQISASQHYQILQEIRRTAKWRERYFKGAVKEYHAIYGIRPNVQEVYQNGGYTTGGNGRSPLGYSSPPRFPKVRQPQ